VSDVWRGLIVESRSGAVYPDAHPVDAQPDSQSVMRQSIPSGLTREHVLLALADLDAGRAHLFGDSRKYELVYDGKRYAPKAVIGLACEHLLGQIYTEFSGGEAPGKANYVLRKLGFTVVQKGEAASEVEAWGPWSEAEVALVVADYFDMLRKELLGEAYVKKEHRDALRRHIDRSDPSVEYKHRNISAVVVGMGLPYISGYKPAANYQALLVPAVEDFLTKNADYLDCLADARTIDPEVAPAAPLTDPEAVFEEPPEHVPLPTAGRPWVTRHRRRTDFVRRDAENRRLGRLGEEFVVELERARLRGLSREDLARRVDLVASTIGDGLGFDVLSFDETDDSEQLVEVKTTGLGKYHPFYVSATEVRCSEDVPAQFHLYRVFDFGREPRVFVLHGSLRRTCQMEATHYIAVATAESETEES
jgi:hypothetical protein